MDTNLFRKNIFYYHLQNKSANSTRDELNQTLAYFPENMSIKENTIIGFLCYPFRCLTISKSLNQICKKKPT